MAQLMQAMDFPKTLRGKAQRAVFRLIAGSIGLPYLERVRENLDTIQGRSRVNAILAEEVGRQAILDPELMERAKARFLGDIAQKQENVEAVARAAQAKVEEVGDADVEAAEQTPDPTGDWMNTFSREAENASSEELRERLAGVLAGEIRNPGSFSRSTIRLISELDQEILQSFQRVLDRRVGDAILRDEAWNKGDMFAVGVLLEDAGLISGSSGLTTRIMRIQDDRNGFFRGDTFSLVITGEPGSEKHTGIWLLTRAGQQVASLLPETDERAALLKVAAAMDKDGVERIIIGRNLPAPPGQFLVAHEEIIWPAQAAAPAFNFDLGNPSAILDGFPSKGA